MHGRVKTRTTEEQKEIARQEKQKKAKAYINSMKIIVDKRSSCTYDQEALDITSNLLTGNPDIITLWNYRREIFLNLKNENDTEGYQKLLENDLYLTEQCLRVNPKSYGSWHHRVWILDNLPEPNWEKELMLCTKYLQLDERNFHCWDYRRTVTQRSNIPDQSEYEYTLEKIHANFSNYSAWHLRSKLLPRIFPDPEKKFPIDEVKHKEELELVENAAFTDPNDQSAWFYQRWLLGLTEPKVFFVFVEVKKDEIFMITSKSIKLGDESDFGVRVEVEVNGEPLQGVWKSNNNQLHSSIWSFKSSFEVQLSDSICLKLLENGVEYERKNFEPFKSVTIKPNFLPTFSENLMETLMSQLSSCEQLLELEPDSKWTLLTSIFLMLSIDGFKYKKEIMDGLDKLCQIDLLRKGYYLDLKSKILIELLIMSHSEEDKKFTLKGENLTSFYHSQYLHGFEEIDLSCNSLQSESLNNFDGFLNCKFLNLNGNKIKNIKNLPILTKLEVLLLEGNIIEEVDSEYLARFPSLRHISLANNPVTCKKESIDYLISGLSGVKLTL